MQIPNSLCSIDSYHLQYFAKHNPHVLSFLLFFVLSFALQNMSDDHCFRKLALNMWNFTTSQIEQFYIVLHIKDFSVESCQNGDEL
jgi:hypothetical protein